MRELVKSKRFLLLIGSPMCTAFSRLQQLNYPKVPPEEVQERIKYGKRHLDFCIELYTIQMNNGIYFLHEHPWTATSWNYKPMQNLMQKNGVIKVRGDMCMFDMVQEDGEGVGQIKKPTGFVTNAPEIAKQLQRVCNGRHRHIQLVGGRAKCAQVYPDKLREALITGPVEQMKEDGRIIAGYIGAVVPDEKLDDEFWDDLSGEALDPAGVRHARKEELIEV